MNNRIGIFIKTCAKDHAWLKWCLLSIKQNAYNFDGVCIITDSDHTNIEEYKNIIKDINGTVIYLDVPNTQSQCQDGIGYLWMQNVKLLWHNYCDFDAVLQIDSDCIISSIISSQYFIKNNQYKWFVRSWSTSLYAQIHRDPLYKLFETNIQYEHMPYNGWILNRQDTKNFHDWIQNKYNCSWWDYLVNKAQKDWNTNDYNPHLKDLGIAKSRGSSVYNAYGGFIELSKSNKYLMIDTDDNYIHDYPIKQYWSWGELSNNITEELRKHLIDSDINAVILNSDINKFDEYFYIIQNPKAYQYIDCITLDLTNKQKLFYHYKVFNYDKNFYLNQIEYEKHILGQRINVDTDFDHIFYSNQYPETKSYLSTCPYTISDRKKLYHHYLHYGSKMSPPFAKNNIDLAIRLTKISESIPYWFCSENYEELCPESKTYFMPQWSSIPKIYRYYHHYLHYGKHNYETLINFHLKK